MGSYKLSDELRRFIQTIISIPHLEAMLLLRQSSQQTWDSAAVARRLYLSPEKAAMVLEDLVAADVCKYAERAGHYIYTPASAQLGDLIDQLADYYSHNLIEVTNMIHSRANASRRAQQFADAFKFKKDQ